MDTDPIPALIAARWWQRHLVIDRTKEIVRAHRFEPGRIRILPIFDDPQTSAFIEVAKDRLRDVRLGEDEFPRKVVRRGEGAGGFRGGERCWGVGEQRGCGKKRYGVRQLV